MSTKSSAKKPMSRGLGKGLSALMSDGYSQTASNYEESVSVAPKQTLALHVIESGRYQPRGHFEEQTLNELADSIRRNGVMQPILVRPKTATSYEIIAGERRWRAAKMAGLSEIPVLIRDLTDKQALELAIVENVQREDLHPLEESAGYQRLMDEFKYTQEELSIAVNKSRSHIANLLRLRALPDDVQLLFVEDKINMGIARALTGISDAEASALAPEIVRKGLNVRQTEKLIRNRKGDLNIECKPRVRKSEGVKPIVSPSRQGEKDPDILALEETLSENLGLKVSIDDRGQSGEINIIYESLEQLDDILRRLGGSV